MRLSHLEPMVSPTRGEVDCRSTHPRERCSESGDATPNETPKKKKKKSFRLADIPDVPRPMLAVPFKGNMQSQWLQNVHSRCRLSSTILYYSVHKNPFLYSTSVAFHEATGVQERCASHAYAKQRGKTAPPPSVTNYATYLLYK